MNIFFVGQKRAHINKAWSRHEACLKLALDVTREVLRSHLKYLMMLLSPSNTSHQSKASLRLLTAMVAASTATAKEVLLKLDFEHNALELLLSRRALRRDYMQFLLAFFLVSSPTVVRYVFYNQDFYSASDLIP